MFASFDVNLTAAQIRDANAPKAAFDAQFFPAAFSAVATSPAAAMASFLQAIPRSVAGNEALAGNESPGHNRDFLSALDQAGFTMVPLHVFAQPHAAGGGDSFAVRTLSALIRIVAICGLATLAALPRLFLDRRAPVDRPAGNQTFATVWLHFTRAALPQFFPGHAGPVPPGGRLALLPPPLAVVPPAAAPAGAGLAMVPPVVPPAAAAPAAAAVAGAAPAVPPLPDVAPDQAGVHANLLATMSPTGAALVVPETFVVTAALSLNAVHTVNDFLVAVPKMQTLLRTVVDPARSPTGSELAYLHAYCTGNPNAVLNPFGFLAVFKTFVPCTGPLRRQRTRQNRGG